MPRKSRNKQANKPIPVYVQNMLKRMRDQDLKLCKGYRPRVIGVTERVECYWFEPNGTVVGAANARWAIKHGLVVPLDLALFDDGNHQTWGLAP